MTAPEAGHYRNDGVPEAEHNEMPVRTMPDKTYGVVH